MDVKISINKPSSIERWNRLCENNGNLLASTHYDAVQAFYQQEPRYFELLDGDQLIAGVKLYHWQSTKIPFVFPYLSRMMRQFGEAIIDSNYTKSKKVMELLNAEVRKYIRKQNIVWYAASNFWGEPDKLIVFNSGSRSHFDVAIIDLKISQEELMQGLHLKHRNTLRKAQQESLIFEELYSCDVLVHLLEQTYASQSSSMPNRAYIENAWSQLSSSQNCKMYAVRSGETYLSVAFIQLNGEKADYTFGGNLKNNLGAGQFLQWNIMLALKSQGIKYYSLGQVAKEKDENNLKFSQGISSFKMRFGAYRVDATSEKVIFKPIRYKLFQGLIKFMSYVSRFSKSN